MRSQAERLLAENTALRDALKKIASGPTSGRWCSDALDLARDVINCSQQIARDAFDPGRPVPKHGSGPVSVAEGPVLMIETPLVKDLRDTAARETKFADPDPFTARKQTLWWRASDEIERLREALESIAKNTCCDRCQEAALVAQSALKD